MSRYTAIIKGDSDTARAAEKMLNQMAAVPEVRKMLDDGIKELVTAMMLGYPMKIALANGSVITGTRTSGDVSRGVGANDIRIYD